VTTPKRPRGARTGPEHDAWLKETGQYEAVMERKRQRDAEFQKFAAEMRRAQAPLIADLKAVGYEVESVWDLVNTAMPYPEALPVLLDHLQRDYPSRVREGIARALATRPKFAWDILTRLYRDEPEGEVKDGIAVALCAAADNEVIGDVIALARDRRHGSSRLLLLRALKRSSDPRAHATLMDLATDPDLKKEIEVILKQLGRRKQKSGDITTGR